MKIKKTLNTILLALAIISTSTYCAQKEVETVTDDTQSNEPSLTLLWETEPELTTCESALYHEETGQIFVSNIEGEGTEKDGVGSISIIDKEGNIVNRNWVTGLNAPKGMAIKEGSLFVTDIDELVEIDIASAEVINRYPVEGAEFLNDAATDGSHIYFSDMRRGKIHRLENGQVKTIAENQNNINGLQFNDQGEMFGLDAEGLKKYNQDGGFEIVNSNVTGGDGLEYLGDGKWLASRWQGEVYFVNGNEEQKLLDTKDKNSNTADIGYIKEERILLVPTFMKNKVAAYRLNY